MFGSYDIWSRAISGERILKDALFYCRAYTVFYLSIAIIILSLSNTINNQTYLFSDIFIFNTYK